MVQKPGRLFQYTGVSTKRSNILSPLQHTEQILLRYSSIKKSSISSRYDSATHSSHSCSRKRLWGGSTHARTTSKVSDLSNHIQKVDGSHQTWPALTHLRWTPSPQQEVRRLAPLLNFSDERQWRHLTPTLARTAVKDVHSRGQEGERAWKTSCCGKGVLAVSFGSPERGWLVRDGRSVSAQSSFKAQGVVSSAAPTCPL